MESKYYSFLLRIWGAEDEDGAYTWWVSLERSDSGEKQVFHNVSEMADYLETFTSYHSVPRGTAED